MTAPTTEKPKTATLIDAPKEAQQLTVVQQRKKAGEEVKRALEAMRGNFAPVLPKSISVEAFERVTLTAINNNPDLLFADRTSLFNAATRAATDGLLPDGREGAFVIFKTDGKALVQWMPMVFGLVKKMRNSGDVSKISAHIVYKNETIRDAEGNLAFEYVISDGEEKFTHRPILFGERGEMVAVYSSVKFKDGTVQTEFMTKADVDKRRNASRSKNSPMWTTWYDEGAKKTAIRAVSKYVSMSAEDRRTIDTIDGDNDFTAQREDARREVREVARQLGTGELTVVDPPKQLAAPGHTDLMITPEAIDEAIKDADDGSGDGTLDTSEPGTGEAAPAVAEQSAAQDNGGFNAAGAATEIDWTSQAEIHDPDLATAYYDAALTKLNSETDVADVAILDNNVRKVLVNFGIKLDGWKKATRAKVKGLMK